MTQPFSILPFEQMDVPAPTVGLFQWKLTGTKATATGRVMATGSAPGDDALASGVRADTEYWFLDGALAATGPATKFELKVVRVTPWNKTDYPDVSKASALARVLETPRRLAANEVPKAGVVSFQTPLGPSGQPSFAAIVFEIPATAPLRAPSWYWTPDSRPHLFGTLVNGNGAVSITMAPPTATSAHDHPKAGWWYVPGQ
jgi:hypothetical protein